jgi:hypothetical protein
MDEKLMYKEEWEEKLLSTKQGGHRSKHSQPPDEDADH